MSVVNRHEYAANVEGTLAWNRLNGHRALQSWFIAESGAGRIDGGHNQGGKWNPLNTTLPMPGSTDYNDSHVKNYVSFGQGVDATVQTLRDPRYRAINAAMTKPNVTVSEIFEAIIASSWGTDKGLDGAYQAYMQNRGFYLTLTVGG